MRFWHPLKLAGLLYMLADASLLTGGIGYDNAWLAISGIAGLLGNASLLLGGSGTKKIQSPWVRRVAPYAERLSLSFYVVQYFAFGLSSLIMYDHIIWGGVLFTVFGMAGSLFGIWIKGPVRGWQPYQVTGVLWLLASLIGIWAGVDSANPGVTIANVCLVFGAICVMLSHRAEFKTG